MLSIALKLPECVFVEKKEEVRILLLVRSCMFFFFCSQGCKSAFAAFQVGAGSLDVGLPDMYSRSVTFSAQKLQVLLLQTSTWSATMSMAFAAFLRGNKQRFQAP